MDMEFGLKIKKTRETFKGIRLTQDTVPTFTSHETGTLFVLVGYLSGFLKSNVRIMIDAGGSLLTITGQKYVEEMVIEKRGMHRNKVEPRTFQKIFRIPENVDIDRIKARFDEEGILRVFMPKIKVGEFSGIWIQEVNEATDEGTQNVAIEMERGEEPEQSPETLSAEDDYNAGGVEDFAIEEDNTEAYNGEMIQLVEEEAQTGHDPVEMVLPEAGFQTEEKEAMDLDAKESEQKEKQEAADPKEEMKYPAAGKGIVEAVSSDGGTGTQNQNQLPGLKMDPKHQQENIPREAPEFDRKCTPKIHQNPDNETADAETPVENEAPSQKQREATSESGRSKKLQAENDTSQHELLTKTPTIPSKPTKDQEIPQEISKNRDRQDGDKRAKTTEVHENLGKDTLEMEDKEVQTPESPVPSAQLSEAPLAEQKLHQPDLSKPPSIRIGEPEISETERSEEPNQKQQQSETGERQLENTKGFVGQDKSNKEIFEDSTDDKHEDLPKPERGTSMKDQSTQTPAWPRKRSLMCSPWLYVSSTLIALLMVVVVQLSKDKRIRK